MKLKTVYVCEKCGFNSQKWLGKCPECEAWNSFTEDVVDMAPAARKHTGIAAQPAPLAMQSGTEERIVTGIGEFDRVLGGGIIEGSMILMSGEPGIGKSTLTLRICEKVASLGKKTLYVSGEESPSQIGLRAKRMGINNENIFAVGETNLENIMQTLGDGRGKTGANTDNPAFVVIDSIQVVSSSEIPSIAGSISQVRYCTETLMKFAKQNRVPIMIIGHVTKDGNLAGPKILEHLVDTVLLIEGERFADLRILRGLKNRFGSTNEIGLFEMVESGMEEVKNASKHFLEGRKEDAFGSAITATIEGTRPLLVEVQALTGPTPFGYPKRAASGYDINRLQLLLAVIQKHLGLNVAAHDVYINIVGGYKLSDPASDLAVIMAVISSLKKTPLPASTVYIGEIGLGGELRNVSQLQKRITESQKIGFENIITPAIKDIAAAASAMNKS